MTSDIHAGFDHPKTRSRLTGVWIPRRGVVRHDLVSGQAVVDGVETVAARGGRRVGAVVRARVRGEGLPIVVVDGGTPVRAEPFRARGQALQLLVESLGRARSAAEIGEVTVQIAADLLGAQAGAVYAAEPHSDGPVTHLRVLHAIGWPTPIAAAFATLQLHAGRPLSDAVRSGVPTWIHDAHDWLQRYPDMGAAGTAAGLEATACLPLRVDGRDLGAMVFSFDRPQRFEADERAYLQTVAALCGQALERIRLRTAEQQARQAERRQLDRMTFLAQSARLMEAPLSVERRLQRLADLVVPEVADWCAVHLVRDGRVDQIAVAHTDAEKVAFVARLEQRYPPDPNAAGGAIQVARSGVTAYVPEITEEMLVEAAVDDDHLELIKAIGLRSYLVLPLLVRGRSLGALTVVQAESDRRFGEDDRTFLTQLATTAATALDNARLFEQQRHIAHVLQTALLPAVLPTVPGLAVAARYHPQVSEPPMVGVDVFGVSEDICRDVSVGGDIYDMVELAGAKTMAESTDGDPAPGWAVMVADVCGKGPEAAALTALIRYTWRAEISHGLPPAQVLARINHALRSRPGPERYRFASMAQVCITLDEDGVIAELANAGHEPPLTLCGDHVEAHKVGGTVLGVTPNATVGTGTLRLGRGDSLVLYTDGVTEARSGTQTYGSERLAAALVRCAGRDANAIADALLADVLTFQDGLARDDIAVLVLQAVQTVVG
jgi:serine phosphatase RsbU (regulator of sigma subunit)